MITLQQILAGKLAPVTDEFDIDGVGRVTLHQLPWHYESQFHQLLEKINDEPTSDDNAAMLDLMLNNVCYMLSGQRDSTTAEQLSAKLSKDQLSQIHAVGLNFNHFRADTLEAIEKN